MRLLVFCGVLAIVPGVFCHPGSDPDIPDWGLPARLLPPGFRNRDRGLEEQGREKRKGNLDGRIRLLKMLQDERMKPRQEKRAHMSTTESGLPKNSQKINAFMKLAELQLKSINGVMSQEKEEFK